MRCVFAVPVVVYTCTPVQHFRAFATTHYVTHAFTSDMCLGNMSCWDGSNCDGRDKEGKDVWEDVTTTRNIIPSYGNEGFFFTNETGA